jgi:Na+-driven multidrug efflux pump
VKKSTWICLLMDLAVSIAIVAGLLLLRTWLFRLFTTDQEVIRIGCRMMVLIVPWYVVYAFIEVLAGALRGVGDVLVPLVITLIGICALRVIWLVGAMEISPTIETIIFSYPVTWLLTALAFIVYYCRRLILENREKHVDKQTRV